jgi:hypothetical protein
MIMDRIQGHKDVKVLECANPVKGLWRMRWDIIVADDSNSATYMEEQFDHKPTKAEVKALIHQYYNDKTEESITSGLTFEGSVVWLSTENQANYKAAYDLAVQTQGESLPYKVKLGGDDNPVYREFSTLQEFKAFYTSIVKHIQRCVEEGWMKKDSFDIGKYE